MTREEEIRKASVQWGKDNVNVIGAMMGFIGGARWADEHPQSPWISPSDELPDPNERVLVCVHKEVRGSIILPKPFEFELNFRFTKADQFRLLRGTCFTPSNLFDEYGFFKRGADVYKILYWMHIPEAPKGGTE